MQYVCFNSRPAVRGDGEGRARCRVVSGAPTVGGSGVVGPALQACSVVAAALADQLPGLDPATELAVVVDGPDGAPVAFTDGGRCRLVGVDVGTGDA